MPKDKSETNQRVIAAARRVFLEKGFEGATMREIADAAGITAAGLYRHFADKEAMFAALVEPALARFQAFFQAHRQLDYQLLEEDRLEALWETGTAPKVVLEVLAEEPEAFRLLLGCSAGTKYADFLQWVVDRELAETLAYLEAARARGLSPRRVDPRELRLLLSAYTGAIFQVAVQDFTRADAERYLRTLDEFFTPGWRAVLGL